MLAKHGYPSIAMFDCGFLGLPIFCAVLGSFLSDQFPSTVPTLCVCFPLHCLLLQDLWDCGACDFRPKRMRDPGERGATRIPLRSASRVRCDFSQRSVFRYCMSMREHHLAEEWNVYCCVASLVCPLPGKYMSRPGLIRIRIRNLISGTHLT